jgi:nucleoside-diphosphate kinase
VERSLVILKPDAVQRGLIGQITARLEQRGIKLVGMRLIHIDNELAARHYAVHKGKAFYDGLIKYMPTAPWC